MFKLKFEPTLNVGHIVQLIVGLATVVSLFYNLKASVDKADFAIRQQNLIIEELKTTQVGLVQNQNLLSRNLSVLISVVQERTKQKIDLP